MHGHTCYNHLKCKRQLHVCKADVLRKPDILLVYTEPYSMAWEYLDSMLPTSVELNSFIDALGKLGLAPNGQLLETYCITVFVRTEWRRNPALMAITLKDHLNGEYVSIRASF